MSLNQAVMSEGYVPAYQMSATPYITSSQISVGAIHEINFPQVTRFFNIQNVGTVTTDKIAVAVTEAGFSTGNYFTLGQGVSFRDELRVGTLYVSCSRGTDVPYQVIAGLTCIPIRNFTVLTGSNGFKGVG